MLINCAKKIANYFRLRKLLGGIIETSILVFEQNLMSDYIY